MYWDRSMVTTLTTTAQNINETLEYIDINSNLPLKNLHVFNILVTSNKLKRNFYLITIQTIIAMV